VVGAKVATVRAAGSKITIVDKAVNKNLNGF
jgi:hypothetical protein